MPEHDFPLCWARPSTPYMVDTGRSNSIMSTAAVAQMLLQQFMHRRDKLASSQAAQFPLATFSWHTALWYLAHLRPRRGCEQRRTFQPNLLLQSWYFCFKGGTSFFFCSRAFYRWQITRYINLTEVSQQQSNQNEVTCWFMYKNCIPTKMYICDTSKQWFKKLIFLTTET